MKSFKEIQKVAEKGDYTQVARIIGKSASLVRMVANQQRADYYNIQRVFSDLLEQRERLVQREKKRQKKLQTA